MKIFAIDQHANSIHLLHSAEPKTKKRDNNFIRCGTSLNHFDILGSLLFHFISFYVTAANVKTSNCEAVTNTHASRVCSANIDLLQWFPWEKEIQNRGSDSMQHARVWHFDRETEEYYHNFHVGANFFIFSSDVMCLICICITCTCETCIFTGRRAIAKRISNVWLRWSWKQRKMWNVRFHRLDMSFVCTKCICLPFCWTEYKCSDTTTMWNENSQPDLEEWTTEIFSPFDHMQNAFESAFFCPQLPDTWSW